jgi:hypothetical protein
LAIGEKAHPTNYRGCRYAKEEMQKRKSQRTPKGIILKSRHPRCVLRCGATGQHRATHRPQTCQVAMAGPAAMEPRVMKQNDH